MKKLLFITTANLSTNPRLFKEILLAEKLKYEVSFVAFRLGGWSDRNDKLISEQIKAKGYYLSALRSPYGLWFFNTLIHQICRLIWPFVKNNLWLTAVAHAKRTFQILFFLPKIDAHFDLVIGHNLGALYPAWSLAKGKGVSFAFDVEDYHPGESSAKNIKGEVKRRELLMSALLPKTGYYSYASPMIGLYTSELVNSQIFSRRFVLNNCFSQKEFMAPSSDGEKLELVWFSQNINKDRGLEWMLPMLDKFKDDIRLTLIGSLNPEFSKQHLTERTYVEIISPLPQKMLNGLLAKYDVGLAIELDTTDFNRQICLTNKIWAYLQSGLFILATNTPAQSLFMSEHRSHGLLVEQNAASFCDGLQEILHRKRQIRKEALYRYTSGREFSWEVESKKLTNAWNEIVS